MDKAKALQPLVRVIEYHNHEPVRSRFPFTYEEADEPKLLELRDRHKLEQAAGGGTEWEQLIALRAWRARQFTHGFYIPPECKRIGPIRWNALQHLEAAAMGASFACPCASIVYIQACLAMGWQARLVEICKAGNEWIAPDDPRYGNSAHTVTEVWSNDFGKWVLMDADCNLHYARAGVPLSATEIRSAWLRGEAEAVTLEQGQPENKNWDIRGLPPIYNAERMKVDFFQNRILDYYHTVRVTLRNNHFSEPQWHTDHGHGFLPQLEWTDALTTPLVMWGGQVRPGVAYTGRWEDFHWSLNQAFIHLACEQYGDPFVPSLLWRVRLDTQTPWFNHYETRLDGGAWTRQPATFLWPLHAGENRIEARTVNRMGRYGAVSRIALSVGEIPAR